MHEIAKEMSVLVIQGDESSQKLILELARKMGSKVVSIKNSQAEDFLFGNLMEKEKTGKLVSREKILKALKNA